MCEKLHRSFLRTLPRHFFFFSSRMILLLSNRDCLKNFDGKATTDINRECWLRCILRARDGRKGKGTGKGRSAFKFYSNDVRSFFLSFYRYPKMRYKTHPRRRAEIEEAEQNALDVAIRGNYKNCRKTRCILYAPPTLGELVLDTESSR